MLEISAACEFDLAAFDPFLDCGFRVSFFGAPPHFKLDGGRVIHECKDGFEPVIAFLRQRAIPFNLCCNTILDPAEIEIDGQTWQTLEQAYSPINGVIVARHWLAERIRHRFPDFRLIFSSIGALTEKWDEKFLFSNYDVVVCPSEHTNNFAFVSNPANWSKVEIFLNAACVPSGPYCLDHYRHYSQVNLGTMADTEFPCPRGVLERSSPLQTLLAFTDVTRYLQLGVKRFKCIDRTRRGQDHRHYLDLVKRASRVLTLLQASYAEATDPLLRLKILLKQSELGLPDVLEKLKEELGKVPGNVSTHQFDLAIRPALTLLQAGDAAWVKKWVAERARDGFLTPKFTASPCGRAVC